MLKGSNMRNYSIKLKKKSTLALLALLLTTTSLDAKDIKTFGCGVTKIAFQTKLNAAYAKKTNKNIIIAGRGGCPRAIQLTNAKKVDIASGCRVPIGLKGEENVKAHKVAWSALVAIANIKNPISNITTKQFRKILKGEITNWKEVGGHDEKIQVYVRNGKTSGVGYSIRMALFDDKDVEFTKDAKRKGSSGPIRRAVSKGVNIFAVDDYSTSSKNKRLKILSIDGIKPTQDNIRNGKYKLSKPLYIYTHGEPKGESKKFLEFALSSEGQKVLNDNGLVTIKDGKKLKVSY